MASPVLTDEERSTGKLTAVTRRAAPTPVESSNTGRPNSVVGLEKKMFAAADKLEFEKAAQMRDEIRALERAELEAR